MALVTAVAFLRGRPWLALVAAGSIAAAVIATELLKLVILERPDLIETTLNGGINSYPSGHTTVGMSVCFAAMLVVPARLRVGTALASGAIGAAFGVAVVAAGWHRPSDAIGSYLVCLSAASAAAALAYRYLPDRGRPREAVRSGASEMGLFGLGLALVAVFGVAALASRGVPIFSAGTGFLVASGALVVASFACAGLLAWAMASAERTSYPPACTTGSAIPLTGTSSGMKAGVSARTASISGSSTGV